MSQNPNSVQSNENLPSPVDKRKRKFVCPFCQAIRYVKRSDRFSIEEIFSTKELKGTVWLIVSRRFSTQAPDKRMALHPGLGGCDSLLSHRANRARSSCCMATIFTPMPSLGLLLFTSARARISPSDVSSNS